MNKPVMILKEEDTGFESEQEALDKLANINEEEKLDIPISEYGVMKWQKGWAIVHHASVMKILANK